MLRPGDEPAELLWERGRQTNGSSADRVPRYCVQYCAILYNMQGRCKQRWALIPDPSRASARPPVSQTCSPHARTASHGIAQHRTALAQHRHFARRAAQPPNWPEVVRVPSHHVPSGGSTCSCSFAPRLYSVEFPTLLSGTTNSNSKYTRSLDGASCCRAEQPDCCGFVSKEALPGAHPQACFLLGVWRRIGGHPSPSRGAGPACADSPSAKATTTIAIPSKPLHHPQSRSSKSRSFILPGRYLRVSRLRVAVH